MVELTTLRGWNLILRKYFSLWLVHRGSCHDRALLIFNVFLLSTSWDSTRSPAPGGALHTTCSQSPTEITLTTTSIFWQNDSTGVTQRPDFWPTIAHHVHIYREAITSLNPTSLALSDGTNILADVLVCATGWRNSLSIFSASDTSRLGLPSPISSLPPESSAKWHQLNATADQAILSTFPSLAHPPRHYEPTITHSPYRLYRMLVPPSDPSRSIVFLGHMTVGNNFRAAECQALWAAAYLDGNITLPSTDKMEAQIALSNAWNRRRYLGKGRAGNWFYYDLVPYTDVLLGDVGVGVRERGWWWRWFGPCVAGDLTRIIEDYRARFS